MNIHGHVGSHQMLIKIPDVEPRMVLFPDISNSLLSILNVRIER